MKILNLLLSVGMLSVLSISSYAQYEAKFQSRADSLFNRLSSISESELSWSPQHVMAKVAAHYELGQDTTANDILKNGNHDGQGYYTKEAFHFNFYSIVRILYEYSAKQGVIDTRKQFTQRVWERDDSYNAWTGEGSENHINMSRTSGYLYAQLVKNKWPNDFSNPDEEAMLDSMKKWIEHSSKRILEVGTGEWNSSNYGAFNIVPWLNLYDFAANQEIKDMAKAVLDYYAAELALHYTQGLIGGAEMRRAGGWESTSTPTAFLAWLWYGHSASPEGSGSDFFGSYPKSEPQAVYASISSYRPPEIARKLAAKTLNTPAYYTNSKPTLWLDDKSWSKQNFYIDEGYTLGASYMPYGGWTGTTVQICDWKLVGMVDDENTVEFATGNGLYYNEYTFTGNLRDPFLQLVQHKNVLIEMEKLPDNLSSVESEIDNIVSQWQTDWVDDFKKRFPEATSKLNVNKDRYDHESAVDGLSDWRSNHNGCFIKYSGSAQSTTFENNIFFVELDKVYLAIRSLRQNQPLGPTAKDSDFYVKDTADQGELCGLVMEAANAKDYNDFSAFITAIKNNTSLTKNLSSDNIEYTNLEGDVIDATYQETGTYREPIYDWGYGATREGGYVIQSSPPFIQPDWPTTKGHGRLASWSVNGDPVDVSTSTEWPVYEGPHLKVNNGVLLLEDDAGQCYQVDYSGSSPDFSNSCVVSNKAQPQYADKENEALTIYPNPASDVLHLEGEIQQATLTIRTVNNKVVKKQTINRQQETDIDISGLPSGLYFIQVKDDTSVRMEKILKL